MQKLEENSSPYAVMIAMIMYSICSSTLLLANKLALVHLPSPSLVSFIQIVFSTIQVLVMKYVFRVKVDELEWHKMKLYMIFIATFVASLYANMKTLSLSNIETVIVFRACTPVLCTILEYIFMDRALPSIRSAIALIIVSAGAIMYCQADSEFSLRGLSAYWWAVIYFFLITFQLTYGKQITSSVKMETVWGPVLYTNILSIIPFFILGSISGEFDNAGEKLANMSPSGWGILLFSCFAGTSIGYTSWMTMAMVSATTFSLVGVVNKFITVLLNVMIWDKHSTPAGLVAVCICLLSGSFYQQAGKRSDTMKAVANDEVDEAK